jgi:hypothetical protein
VTGIDERLLLERRMLRYEVSSAPPVPVESGVDIGNTIEHTPAEAAPAEDVPLLEITESESGDVVALGGLGGRQILVGRGRGGLCVPDLLEQFLDGVGEPLDLFGERGQLGKIDYTLHRMISIEWMNR